MESKIKQKNNPENFPEKLNYYDWKKKFEKNVDYYVILVNSYEEYLKNCFESQISKKKTQSNTKTLKNFLKFKKELMDYKKKLSKTIKDIKDNLYSFSHADTLYYTGIIKRNHTNTNLMHTSLKERSEVLDIYKSSLDEWLKPVKPLKGSFSESFLSLKNSLSIHRTLMEGLKNKVDKFLGLCVELTNLEESKHTKSNELNALLSHEEYSKKITKIEYDIQINRNGMKLQENALKLLEDLKKPEQDISGYKGDNVSLIYIRDFLSTLLNYDSSKTKVNKILEDSKVYQENKAKQKFDSYVTDKITEQINCQICEEEEETLAILCEKLYTKKELLINRIKDDILSDLKNQGINEKLLFWYSEKRIALIQKLINARVRMLFWTFKIHLIFQDAKPQQSKEKFFSSKNVNEGNLEYYKNQLKNATADCYIALRAIGDEIGKNKLPTKSQKIQKYLKIYKSLIKTGVETKWNTTENTIEKIKELLGTGKLEAVFEIPTSRQLRRLWNLAVDKVRKDCNNREKQIYELTNQKNIYLTKLQEANEKRKKLEEEISYYNQAIEKFEIREHDYISYP